MQISKSNARANSKISDDKMFGSIPAEVLATNISIQSCKESFAAFYEIDKRKKTEHLLEVLIQIL